ncbi:MAG: hypothetical protein Q9191_005488 [Dirinaria sp. TL-2023a]
MSLRHARGVFSSTQDVICLFCHLRKIYPHGRQRLRSKHTGTSNSTASSGELAFQLPDPKIQKTKSQKAIQYKSKEPTVQPIAPDHGLENPKPVLSQTAGQTVAFPSNPPSPEAAKRQQILQHQYAERRRQSNSQIIPVNKPNTSNENQASISKANPSTEAKQQETKLTSSRQRRRRKQKLNKLKGSPRNQPSYSVDPAATDKSTIPNKEAKKKGSPPSTTDGPGPSKAEPRDEDDKSHVIPAVQDTSLAVGDNSKLVKLLSNSLEGGSKVLKKVDNTHKAKSALRVKNRLRAVLVSRKLLNEKGSKIRKHFRKISIEPRRVMRRKHFRKISIEPRRVIIRRHMSNSIEPTPHPNRNTKHNLPKREDAVKISKGSVLRPPPRTGSTENLVIEAVKAAELELQPINLPQPAVPNLSYGLDRVLFNPGVYHIQDPRSRVYNFDPYLQKIMPVVEFDFDALKGYITSSRDKALDAIARESGKRYTGSSSSMTGILAHFHYLLSQWRRIQTDMLSSEFPAKDTTKTFTQLQRAPNAVFLRWKDGHYAIDADKEFSGANILMMLGKSMEKLLTLSKDDFEKYRKSNPAQVSPEERNAPESYHYSTVGNFLMRSQLDAHDSRLPGTGMFDLKTRAVVAVRMDAQQYEKGMDYEIKTRHGAWESYEREYFDMIRAAFLKYSLQVRMGRMDGIFVAFHNTQRIFGFQYISCSEMDAALHGQWDLALGDQEFKLSLGLLNKVLDRATKKYPKQSLRIHFETREAQTPFMYIFAEPMTEDQINELQSSSDAKVEEFERNILGLCNDNGGVEESDGDDGKWADMQASVEKQMEKDETSVDASEVEEEHLGQIGHEAGSSLYPSQPSDDDYILAETDPQDFDEGLVAASRSDRDIQHAEENEDSLGFDIEDQDALFQEVQNVTASDETAFQEHEESSDAERSENDTETLGEATTDEQWASIQDSSELETGAEDENQPSNTDSTTLTAATEQPPTCTEEDENFTTQADAPFLDTVAQDLPPPSEPKDLLAMTLTIRNKVNDKFVLRPQDLTSQDRWTVEYALADVQSPEKAWTLYRASQARRRKQLEAEDEDEGKAADWYIRNLRELSRKGKEWRRRQDEIDKARPKVVLGA